MLDWIVIPAKPESFFAKYPKPRLIGTRPVLPVERGERSAEQEVLTIPIRCLLWFGSVMSVEFFEFSSLCICNQVLYELACFLS